MYKTEPAENEIARMREHLASEHGRDDFDLARDVSFGDHAPERAVVHWLAQATLHGARYTCDLCPGLIFVLGRPPYGNSWRGSLLALGFPEELRVLTGGARDQATRAELITSWDRGELASALVGEIQRRRAQATKTANRPVVEEGRDRCQECLLELVRTGLTVDDAIDALDAMRTDDPERYHWMLYGELQCKRETFRNYWRAIPLADRIAARQAGSTV